MRLVLAEKHFCCLLGDLSLFNRNTLLKSPLFLSSTIVNKLSTLDPGLSNLISATTRFFLKILGGTFPRRL